MQVHFTAKNYGFESGRCLINVFTQKSNKFLKQFFRN
jgi:hypothetical protein